jgi:hypothetical protein
MNYLQAINKVLVRLREREVESVNETEYSILVGDLINDSINYVEQAWDWSALRTTLTVTTSNNVFNYELNGSQNNIKVLSATNASSYSKLNYQTAAWFDEQYLTDTPATGSPDSYSFNGISSDGDTLIDVYPKPDKAYTLRFNVVQRSSDLVGPDEKIKVPSRLVILFAYAKAVEERGEDNGQTGNNAYLAANSYMADAIALDAAKHPEETVWYSV